MDSLTKGDKVRIKAGVSSQAGKYAVVTKVFLAYGHAEFTILDFEGEDGEESGWYYWPDEYEKVDDGQS